MKHDASVEIESSVLSPTDGSIKFVFRKSGLRFEGIYFHYDGPDADHCMIKQIVGRELTGRVGNGGLGCGE